MGVACWLGHLSWLRHPRVVVRVADTDTTAGDAPTPAATPAPTAPERAGPPGASTGASWRPGSAPVAVPHLVPFFLVAQALVTGLELAAIVLVLDVVPDLGGWAPAGSPCCTAWPPSPSP